MTEPTTPAAYATPEDLATYMQQSFDTDQTATAQMLLGFAGTLIRTEFTDIDNRDPAIDPELPKLVSLELVSRKMWSILNDGATSVTESMDDISVTTQLAGRRFGGLELDDWAIGLLSPEPSSGPRAFGIRTGTGARVPNNPYDSQACTGYAQQVWPYG